MIPMWYAAVSFMVIVYVVLDGRNFGAGMLHWFVARTPQERRQVIAAIGPLWSWHEVWLVGFGGTLLAIFPKVMASAFSGYYLALMLILWCLLLRAMALEVGGHINDRQWQGFWDFVFAVASSLLAILFGAAAGNVARGVPVDSDGTFSMAFFTTFNVGRDVGLLDWYTVSVAIFTTVLLAAHGATYLTFKTEGAVHDRCATLAPRLWLAAVPLFLIITAETYAIRPELFSHGVANPVAWLGIIVLVVAISSLVSGLLHGGEKRAFLGANFLIIGLLATGAATLFPVMLYSTHDPAYSLTAYNAVSPADSLFVAAIWWPFGFVFTITYFIFISRQYTGKVSLPHDTQGFY